MKRAHCGFICTYIRIYTYTYTHTHTDTHSHPQLHLHPHSFTSKRICVQSLLCSLSLTPSYVLHQSVSYVYRKPLIVYSVHKPYRNCISHTTLSWYHKPYIVCCVPSIVYRAAVAYLISYIVCYIQPSMCVFQRERVWNWETYFETIFLRFSHFIFSQLKSI